MSTSGRSLGLGSRANNTKSVPAARQTSTAMVKVTTTNNSLSITNATTKQRRGFGLFDDDGGDDDDSDAMEIQKEPVLFSGDLSGFTSMSDSEGPSRSSAIKSSSRTSSLTTPSRSRRNTIASRRSTPYSSTTSRALLRAKSKEAAEKEEEQLISESMFESSPAVKQKKARFVMSGALGYSEDEQLDEQSTEPDTDLELKKTSGRELFSRKAKSPRHKSADSNQHLESDNVVKKTWGQWLKSILPEAVTKPVEAIIHHPHTERNRHQSVAFPKTPEAQYKDGALPIPGSFEKAVALPPKGENYAKLNIVHHDSQRTPVRNSEGLFQYTDSSPFNVSNTSSPGSVYSSPGSIKKGSRAPSAPTSAKRMVSMPPVISYRKPSNFIERMRRAKKQKRYDPYSRPSAAPRKGSIAPTFEEVVKDLTPEEELELLERREKDRKVQEAEDRYLRRETLRRLGRPVEDEEMSDTLAVSTEDKEEAVTVEDTPGEGMEEDRSGTNTPPDSPPQKQSALFQDIPKSSGAPLFQFKNIAPKSASSTEKPESVDADNPVFSFTSTTSFSSEPDNDKENIHSPPPPPTMSHRELPPTTTTAPAAPPPSPPTLNSTSLFPAKQPPGGWGLNDAPVLQPPSQSSAPPLSPSMRRFDKFKPRVSSGLRESATIEKENEHDKENPSDSNNASSSSSSSSGKAGKAAFGMQVVAKPSSGSSSGALREVGRNAPVSTGVKVDVRAKIAAMPVGELSQAPPWPDVEVITMGDEKIQQAVRDAWSVQTGWLGEWAGDIFAGARARATRQ